MLKRKNKFVLTTLVSIICILIGAFSCTLTWFAKMNSMNLNIGGSVLSEYFDSGDGSQEDPFVITRPKHWENLVWLHNNVSNFYQAITDVSDASTSTNEKGYYFQIGKLNEELNDGILYVYDYRDDGMLNDSELSSRVLNLKGLSSLIPIGSSSKPFIGELISDGITISGFDVLGFEDKNNNLTQDSGEKGFNDVGIFGYIGKDSLISGIYFDNFTIHLANADCNGAGANNDLHNTTFHDTDADGSLDQIYAGYIAGHIHYSSAVTNVYINNCIMDGGSAALSGFSYFGIAENQDGTPKPTPMEEIKATKLAGDGNSFGGSIDMYGVYDRLARIYSSTPSSNQTKFVSAETLIRNEVSGEKSTFHQDFANVVGWYKDGDGNTYSYRYASTEAGGVFNFPDDNNNFGDRSTGNIYQCLYGESTHYTKTVTTYTFIDDWYDCFFIQSGNNYFNHRYYSDIRNVTNKNEAAGWCFDSSHHLYTKVFDVTYYLNRNDYSLVLGTTANTTWNQTDDNEIYTIINGVNYYLNYVDTWCLSPYNERYTISDGNDNYLCGNDANIFNTQNENSATKYFITEVNGQFALGYNYGNQIYYIAGTNAALVPSRTPYYWDIQDGHYLTSYGGEPLYIVFENGQWLLRTESYTTISNNGYNLNVTDSVCKLGDVTTWHFTSTTGDTQIYCLYQNAKYYLSYRNNTVIISETPTIWHRNGNSLYVTISDVDFYLIFDTSWKIVELEYYLIRDNSSSNFLVVDGIDSFSNTDDISKATHFYFSNGGTNSSGAVTCLYNGTPYYLQNSINSTTHAGSLKLSNTPTVWSNNGTSLYEVNGDYTYYLEHSVDWHIRTYPYGFYITDGTNYMTVSGTSIGNTTNAANASIFEFSTTGTNPSGYISLAGTNYCLRDDSGILRITNNTTQNRTSFSNNGTNIYSGSNYLSCVDGHWGLSSSATISGYTIQRNNYYLYCDSNGNISTSSSSSNRTLFLAKSGQIRVANSAYYLTFEDFETTQSNLSTTTDPSHSNLSWMNQDDIVYQYKDGYFYIIYQRNNRLVIERQDNGNVTSASYLTISSATRTRGASRATSASNNVITTKVSRYTTSEPTITTTTYNSNISMRISEPISVDYSLNFFDTQLQNCEKEIKTNVKSGNPTYFPLRVDKDESTGAYPAGYAASEKNTGYMVSGANLTQSGQAQWGDIRVAGWPISNISSSYNGSNFTTIYTVDGTSSNSIRALTNAEKQDATYGEALSQFGTTLSQSGGKVYGVHFMDAAISKNHTIRASQATILGKTYYDYELPEDSIDFNVYQKGKISFFAGEYFTNNNTFFSLHRIFRDENNDISEIKEISEVYDHAQKHDKANYIYKFSDGTYTNANGTYTGSRTKDSLYSSSPVFKTSWITNPTGLNTNSKRLFYFSIPCNAGEFALGSVSGKNGAYLCYLDIATNGGDTKLEEMKTTETATTFNVDYRSASETTTHSILQLGAEIPETVNPSDLSITVSFDSSLETCEGTEYTQGIYNIYVTNKTDELFELCVLVIDDNDDLYDDFNYAYRIIYTNNAYTEEIIMCTPLNDPDGQAKDYWQRLAIFEIPPDDVAAESDYTEE